MQICRVARRCCVVALAPSLLAACASGGGTAPAEHPLGREESSFVVCRSSWFGNALECGERGADPVATAASENLALRPHDPWLGTVGMKSGVRHAYEYGMGLCVPNPGREAAPVARSVGLGCWLTLDF